jgi:hypothetical protein
MNRKRLVVMPAALVLLSVPCCTSRGYVAKEWSLTMRELGINPVFPPREDVQVGDIYAYPAVPGEENRAFGRRGFLPLGLWIASLELFDEEGTVRGGAISEFYANRDSFPLTPEDGSEARDPSRDIYAGGDVHRLRLVGFPMFMSTTFRQGDLSALVPTEAVNLAFGSSFTASKAVTVQVPSAESFGLPAEEVRKAMFTSEGEYHYDEGAPEEGFLLSYLPSRRGVAREGYFIVMTEVYYTRVIDVTVHSKSAWGAALKVTPVVAPSEGGEEGQPGESPAAAEPAGPAAGEERIDFASATPQQIADGLNRQLDRMVSRTEIGGDFRFVSVTDQSVGMRRTFDRPIAIGYRGFYIVASRQADGTVKVTPGPLVGAVAGRGGFFTGATVALPTARD